MKLLHAAPSGFEGIRKAFSMAQHLPATHKRHLQVGLMHEGSLFAIGHLDGYRQVSFFSEHLRELGWREHLLGGDEDMHGCDLLFSHPGDQQAAVSADPSFIRRVPVELWGARPIHPGER
jgi:hypothetical protein